MNDELTNTKNFLQAISDTIHFFIKNNVSSNWATLFQILAKFVVFAGLIYLVDLVVKVIINSIFKLLYDNNKYPVMKSIYVAKITNSFAHIIAVLFASFAVDSLVQTKCLG